jgi:hypothetical protein
MYYRAHDFDPIHRPGHLSGYQGDLDYCNNRPLQVILFQSSFNRVTTTGGIIAIKWKIRHIRRWNLAGGVFIIFVIGKPNSKTSEVDISLFQPPSDNKEYIETWE